MMSGVEKKQCTVFFKEIVSAQSLIKDNIFGVNPVILSTRIRTMVTST